MEGSQFYLASSVDDLSRKLLPFIFDELAERILNGRVVALDKMSVDKLYRER